MTNRAKYIGNTAWVLFDKFFSIGFTLVVGILVARYLGPEQMGVWGYAQGVIAIIAVFSSLGVQPVAIRDMVPEKADCGEILGSVMTLRLFGSIFGLLVGVTWATFSPDPRVQGLLLLLVIANVVKIFDSYDYLFQAKLQSKYGVLVRIIWQISSGGGKLVLIWFHGSLMWLGVITLGAALLQSMVYYLIGGNVFRLGLTNLKVDWQKIKSLVRECWPLILSGVATVVYLEIDKIMLKSMASNEAVGQYSLAVRLSTAAVLIIPALCQSLYPAVIRAKQVSRKLYDRRLSELYSLTLWAALIMGGSFAATAKWLIPSLVGHQYDAAIPIFQLLCFSGVFVAITLVSAHWLMIERLQIFSFHRNLVGMVINVILNVIFIPQWGGGGAAVASIIARAASTIGFMLAKKSMRYHLNLILRALFLLPLLRRNSN